MPEKKKKTRRKPSPGDYLVYCQVMDMVCELLLRENTENQQVIPDIQEFMKWKSSCIMAVQGHAENRHNAIRLDLDGHGGVDVLLLDPSTGGTTYSFPGTSMGKIRRNDLGDTQRFVRFFTSLLKLDFRTEQPRHLTERYQKWSRLLVALWMARTFLGPGRWCLYTSFHGGWEKYYLFFQKLWEPIAFGFTEYCEFWVSNREKYDLRWLKENDIREQVWGASDVVEAAGYLATTVFPKIRSEVLEKP